MMALTIGCGDINGDINVDKEKDQKEESETETTSIDGVGDPSALPDETADEKQTPRKKSARNKKAPKTQTTVEVNTEVNVTINNGGEADEDDSEYVDLDEGCTDWEIEGDFSIAISTTDEAFDFYGYMGAGSCDYVSMTFDPKDPKTTATGSICSNNVEAVLMHEKNLRNLEALRLRRDKGYIYYDILVGGKWVQTQFISIQSDFETPVTFCKYQKDQ